MIEWNKLASDPILSEIKEEWTSLLDNKNLKEGDYHDFIKNFPSLFLITHPNSYLAISKLKLGSEYETDFVVVKEGYSDGTIYELIEIETPHTKLFDSKGKPTAKFNASLQQIRDWKRWLINHKSEIRKILPTTSTRVIKDSRLKFKIIIGRSENNPEALEKRRQISEDEDIEIMSFDRVTDLLKYRQFFPQKALIHSSEMDALTPNLQNELANPFFVCHSHSEWMKICKEGNFHIYPALCEDIIKTRTMNRYYEYFMKKYGG